MRLAGRPSAAPYGGVVRRWTVRGTRGRLALQVLRPRQKGYDAIARSVYERVPDAGVRTFRTNLPVRRGDLVGLAIAPGAAVGVRSGGGDTATGRWFGPLAADVRAPDGPPGSGFDHELLLRAEIDPGARWRVEGRLTGRAAAAALPGRVVMAADLGAGRRLLLTRLGDRVALDLLDGSRRVARVRVDGAEPGGRPLALIVLRTTVARVDWRNSAAATVSHDYAIGEAALTPRS
jgi:hypothetical protein